MTTYQTILVAIDLADESSEVLDAAQEVAGEQKAKLHVLTVIRPLNYFTGIEGTDFSQALANFEPEARAGAQQALEQLCGPRKIKGENLHIEFGKPADVIKSHAESLQADLIVVGTRGRHGLGMLLGSTANGVLHGSPTDVLAVRIQPHS